MIGSSAPNPFAVALAQALDAVRQDQPQNIFAQAIRDAVPSHARLFASTLAGDRSPITERNFSPAELQAMADVIATSRKPGAVSYEDYIAMNPNSFGSPDSRLHIGPLRGGVDYGGTPAQTAVANSLGQFRYKRLPDGRTVIDDSYDWDSGRPDGGPQSGRPGLFGALANAFQTGSLEQLGAAAVPDAAHGRRVHVTLQARPQPQGIADFLAMALGNSGRTPR